MSANGLADAPPDAIPDDVVRCAIVSCLVILLGGCSKSERDRRAVHEETTPRATPRQAANDEPIYQQGWYRLAFDDPKDDIPEVPFLIRVDETEAMLARGRRLEPVPRSVGPSGELRLDFRIFRSRIDLLPRGDGFGGHFIVETNPLGSAKLPITAVRVPEPTPETLFPGPAGAVAGFDGSWLLEFDDDGVAVMTVATSEGEARSATVLFSSGNTVHVSGRVVGRTLKLSDFDGTSPYLLIADVSDGAITGTWFAGQSLDWRASFSGKKVETAELRAGPTIAKDDARLEVPGVDLSVIAGKPALVEIAATWCITCKYLAPFLKELYRESQPKGLEFLTLTYEFTDDEAVGRARAQEFKDTYQVPWQVVPVHGSLDKAADILPGALDGMDLGGLPFTILVEPDGTIAYVRAGFPSDAALEAQKEALAELRAAIAKLVQE